MVRGIGDLPHGLVVHPILKLSRTHPEIEGGLGYCVEGIILELLVKSSRC
jgi:hypothetical protein